MELRSMEHIAPQKAPLFLHTGIVIRIASPGFAGVVVVVTPFREVVCEFQPGRVGRCVFEVDYD